MDLSFFTNIVKSSYSSLGSLFFWAIVAVFAIFSILQLYSTIYNPIKLYFEDIKYKEDSFIKKYLLNGGSALSLIVFGLTMWLLNTSIFLIDGFVLIISMNSWLIGLLVTGMFTGIIPSFVFNILALGFTWYISGFEAFILLLLLHVVPWILSTMLVAQSNSNDMDYQYDYFGYIREIFLTGTLCLQIISIPVYWFSKSHWAGWVFADLLASTLLLMHLIHTIKYSSKNKVVEEEFIDDDFVNSLYRTFPTYHLALFFLSSITYNQLEMIEKLKGPPEFFCSTSASVFLNFIAAVGFLFALTRVIKNKFFSTKR